MLGLVGLWFAVAAWDRGGMACLALCVALTAGGCVSAQPPAIVPPVVAGSDGTGILRRAVCIGVSVNSDDKDCLGADVDARIVAGWMTDRRVAVLIDGAATLSGVSDAIWSAADGMGSNDLLTVSISGHGTTRTDTSGDEADGRDEGAVLFDGVWWDDDVWTFLSTLPPCRVELYTDTCHAAGNWRAVQEWLGIRGPQEEQLELDLGFPTARGEWGGQLIQFAGCRESSYSYGGGDGGTWTQALDATRRSGRGRAEWFDAAAARMPANQQPELATFNASAEFLHGEGLR